MKCALLTDDNDTWWTTCDSKNSEMSLKNVKLCKFFSFNLAWCKMPYLDRKCSLFFWNAGSTTLFSKPVPCHFQILAATIILMDLICSTFSSKNEPLQIGFEDKSAVSFHTQLSLEIPAVSVIRQPLCHKCLTNGFRGLTTYQLRVVQSSPPRQDYLQSITDGTDS
jgi:hypothetical protein